MGSGLADVWLFRVCHDLCPHNEARNESKGMGMDWYRCCCDVMLLLILGGNAGVRSLGLIMPAFAFALAEILNAFFDEDVEDLTIIWGCVLIGVGVFNLGVSLGAMGSFAVVGERLTKRLRIALFTAYMKQVRTYPHTLQYDFFPFLILHYWSCPKAFPATNQSISGNVLYCFGFLFCIVCFGSTMKFGGMELAGHGMVRRSRARSGEAEHAASERL